MKLSVPKLIIGWAIGLFIYMFYSAFIDGYLFSLHPKTDFDSQKSYLFWIDMTSTHRLVFSDEYEAFFQRFLSTLQAMENQNPNIDVSVKREEKDITTELGLFISLKDVHNILVVLTPKDETLKKNKPLLICAHMDGHALEFGGTAYDDAINCVAMYGCIDALLRKDIKIQEPIYFLFDGSEEFGLQGAQVFADLHGDTDFNYLNLEAMGSSRPFALLTKSSTNSRAIQSAYSKVKGAIGVTFINDLYNSGITDSGSACSIFDKANWTGAMSVFLGAGTHYHTKYDMIYNSLDLELAGNQLLQFLINYKPSPNGNAASYGIAPFMVVMPNKALYVIVPITFCIVVCSIIFFSAFSIRICKSKKSNSLLNNTLDNTFERRDSDSFISEFDSSLFKTNLKNYGIDLLKGIAVVISILIIFVLFSILLYVGNTCSFAGQPTLFVFTMSLSGVCLYVLAQRITKVKDWAAVRLTLISILNLISVTLDTTLPLWFITLEALAFYVWNNRIWRWTVYIIQCFTMALFFVILNGTFFSYSARFSGIISDLVTYLILFFYSTHLSLPLLSLTFSMEEEQDCRSRVLNSHASSDDSKMNQNGNENSRYNSLLDHNQGDKEDILGMLREYGVTFNSRSGKFAKFLELVPFILIIVVVFVYWMIAPAPFSKVYCLRGAFAEDFFENGTARMSFTPEQSENIEYIKRFSRNTPIQLDRKFKRALTDKPAYTWSLDSPKQPVGYDWKPSSHSIDLKRDGSKVKFDIKMPEKTASIFIMVHCGSKDNQCVKSSTDFDSVKPDKDGDALFLLMGYGTNLKYEMEIPESGVKAEIFFVTMQRSPEFSQFRYMFGDAIVQSQRVRAIQDSVYPFERTLP